jgi:hypothetical protein
VTQECTFAAGHFDDHSDALKPYGAHHLMQHDQGFTRSHWTSPSGDYSLRIPPAAAKKATINKTTMQNVPTLLAVSMVIAMWRYNTVRIAQWMRFVAFIKATKRHHRASTRSDRHQSDTPMPMPVVSSILSS